MARNAISRSRGSRPRSGDPDAWPARGRPLPGPLAAIAFGGWLAAATSFPYYLHLAEGAPRVASGTCIHPLANHGDTFYVTSFQYHLFHGLLLGGGLVFLLAVGTGMLVRILQES